MTQFNSTSHRPTSLPASFHLSESLRGIFLFLWQKLVSAIAGNLVWRVSHFHFHSLIQVIILCRFISTSDRFHVVFTFLYIKRASLGDEKEI